MQADFGVIDAHVHLWPQDRAGWPPLAIAEQPFPAALDARAETLVAQMDAYGIARSIVVQTPWYAHDDGYLLESAARFAGRLTIVGCLPLRLESCDVDAYARRLGRAELAGLRAHILGRDAATRIRQTWIDPVLARARDLDKPILLWCRHPRAHLLYGELAARFPGLKLVIDHMGYASPVFGATPESLEGLLALARHRGIHVKLSTQYQHSVLQYPWRDVFELQARLIDAFGAERCCWGSNWPMQIPMPDFAQRLALLAEAFPFRHATERDWVLGRTAAALWP